MSIATIGSHPKLTAQTRPIFQAGVKQPQEGPQLKQPPKSSCAHGNCSATWQGWRWKREVRRRKNYRNTHLKPKKGNFTQLCGLRQKCRNFYTLSFGLRGPIPRDFKLKGTSCQGLKDSPLHAQRNQPYYVCNTATDIYTRYPSHPCRGPPKPLHCLVWETGGGEEKLLFNGCENSLAYCVNSSFPNLLFFTPKKA